MMTLILWAIDVLQFSLQLYLSSLKLFKNENYSLFITVIGLFTEIREYETGIASNRKQECYGEILNYFVLTTHQ